MSRYYPAGVIFHNMILGLPRTRSPPAQGLDVPWSSSISHTTGLLPAEREVVGVEVPDVCPGVTFMFPDEQFYRNGSASQGQVGVVDSGGYPTRRCPSSRVPWADSTLSSVGLELRHHVVPHELLGQYWSRRRPWTRGSTP